jgi:hypothetical protein
VLLTSFENKLPPPLLLLALLLELMLFFILASLAPSSVARFIGAKAILANGEPSRISIMTALVTTSGTYCLHSSAVLTTSVAVVDNSKVEESSLKLVLSFVGYDFW